MSIIIALLGSIICWLNIHLKKKYYQNQFLDDRFVKEWTDLCFPSCLDTSCKPWLYMWSITISFYRNGWLVHLIQEVLTYIYLSKTCDRQTSRKVCFCVIVIKIYVKSVLSKIINRYFNHAFNVKNVDKVIEISHYHNISVLDKVSKPGKTILY